MGDPALAIRAASLSPDDVAAAQRLGTALVILPIRRTEDGVGVYPEQSLFLAKTLRPSGASVDFLDKPNARVFEARKSALVEALQNVIIGVGGGVGATAAWEGIMFLLNKVKKGSSEDAGDSTKSPAVGSDQPLDIIFVDLDARSTPIEYRVRGPVEEVIRAVQEIRRGPDSERQLPDRVESPEP